MTRIGKYLRVEDMGIEWAVWDNNGDLLGSVQWYPRWRRHILCGVNRDGVFSWDCLRDLSVWMKTLDDARKA
jgi:hypothetical protein